MPSLRAMQVLMLLLAVFLSCTGQKKSAMNENKEVSSDSPLTLVAEGNYAGTDTVITHVIESQKSLIKFFSSVNKTRKPGIPVPKVDFSKQMVVIYCSGNNGNGTNPSLDVAQETDSELVLGIVNKTGENSTSNTVSPFRVYTMPLTPKKISFKAVE